MKTCLGLCLALACASAFIFTDQTHSELYHDVLFQYHPIPKLMVGLTYTECYIIPLSDDAAAQIDDQKARFALQGQIYSAIKAHTGETKLSPADLAQYQDLLLASECVAKGIFRIDMAPGSSGSTGGSGSTDMPPNTVLIDS